MDVFYKLPSADSSFNDSNLLQRIFLNETDLETLTPENFKEKVPLGFDIQNASELRYFLSQVRYIKAKAEGLILLSVDSDDSLSCEEWKMEVGYNLQNQGGMRVDKEAEYRTIPCLDEWKMMVGFPQDSGIKPSKKHVVNSLTQASFINLISLFCNLLTYYFVVTLLVNTSKYYMLEKQKTIKSRWVELRKNAEHFSQSQMLEKSKNQSSIPEPEKIVKNYLTFANFLLVFSNTLMLISNIFIIIESLPINIGVTSNLDRYVLKLLGIGCFASWINIGTLLSSLPKFRVVCPLFSRSQQQCEEVLLELPPFSLESSQFSLHFCSAAIACSTNMNCSIR